MIGLISRIPASLPEGWEAWTVHDSDSDPDDILQNGDPEYEEEDKARVEAYYRDEWSYIGVVVRKPCPCCGAWVYSPGLWGIEDDSEPSYLIEVAGDEARGFR